MSDKPSASLAQARELYNLLIEIDQKLTQTETSAKKAELSYADLYNVLQDVFFIIKQMGLPPEVEQTIMLVHRLVIAMNSLRLALNALTIATITSPVGWLIAGLGASVSVLSAFGGLGSTMSRRQR